MAKKRKRQHDDSYGVWPASTHWDWKPGWVATNVRVGSLPLASVRCLCSSPVPIDISQPRQTASGTCVCGRDWIWRDGRFALFRDGEPLMTLSPGGNILGAISGTGPMPPIQEAARLLDLAIATEPARRSMARIEADFS